MFVVYSKPGCTYCTQAKALLEKYNKAYHEIQLDFGQARLADDVFISRENFLLKYPSQKTLPYILAPDEKVIGSFSDLVAYLDFDF